MRKHLSTFDTPPIDLFGIYNRDPVLCRYFVSSMKDKIVYSQRFSVSDKITYNNNAMYVWVANSPQANITSTKATLCTPGFQAWYFKCAWLPIFGKFHNFQSFTILASIDNSNDGTGPYRESWISIINLCLHTYI